MFEEGNKREILMMIIGVGQSLQIRIKLVVTTKKDILNLSALSYKISIKELLHIKRENNWKIPVK